MCIVYGGGGFIGSHLCEELLENNYDVTIFDKINFSKKNIDHFIDDVKIIEGDFLFWGRTAFLYRLPILALQGIYHDFLSFIVCNSIV